MEERIKLANNLKVLRFSCMKCGRCCKDEKTFVNITFQDILRLHTGLKYSLEDIMEVIGFYTFTDVNVKEFMNHMVYSPLHTEKGLAYIGLLKKKNYRCTFLDQEDNCTIYPHRPTICRTFPFTYLLSDNGKSITKTIGYTRKGIEYCPGIKKTASIIKKKKISELLVKSLAEIVADAKMIETWNRMVKKKQITPKAGKYIASILLMERKLKEEYSS